MQVAFKHEKFVVPWSDKLETDVLGVCTWHQGISMKIVHAGTSFIQQMQRQYSLKRLEEQAREASVHEQLDDLEQVSKALTLI